MSYSDERGYIIPAFNTADVDYVECAKTLAKSLRYYHPDVKICLMTSEAVKDPLFDYVRVVEDQGGYANDWQVYYQSPFHETVKLEADMLIASPFDHWWTYFRHYDLWTSTGCNDFRNQTAVSRHYRKIIDANHLPDVYNAITYWRVSPTAKQFFDSVRILFNNWHSVQNSLVYAKDELPNTDLAYAVVASLSEHLFTGQGGPRITHMKSRINELTAEDWSKQLVWEIVSGQIRVNGHTQHGVFHYHVKDLAKQFGKCYD